MQPIIRELKKRKLFGMHMKTSLSENRTMELWQGFMPRRKEINGLLNDDLFSIQIYTDNTTFGKFTSQTVFEKWAAVEVSDDGELPDGMESLIIPAGKYAVFTHKGLASTFWKTSQYIYENWLPNSPYRLDNRPHFEIMGKKYLGHENPNSEEEVFIPIAFR